MAEVISRRPLSWEGRVRTWVCARFVVDKAVVGQAFLRVLRLTPVDIITPTLLTHRRVYQRFPKVFGHGTLFN
jgi:hypothetical protein